MKRILLSLLAAGCLSAAELPQSRKDNFREVIHGTELADPYRWLEEDDSPETRQWIKAQSAYTRAVLPAFAEQRVAKRLATLMSASRITIPQVVAGTYYFLKRRAGEELWSTYRRRKIGGPDELILDPRTFKGGMDARMIGVSRNGLMAYAVRRGGEDETEIRFKELQSLRDLPVSIPRHLNRGFALKQDGSGAFYTIHDREKGPRINYIDLRSGKTAEVFGGNYTPSVFVYPALVDNDRYLVVHVQHGWARNDLYVQDLRSSASPKPIVKGIDSKFEAAPAGSGRLVVRTTWKAPNHRVMLVDLGRPQVEHWKEIVPESNDPIQRAVVIGGELFVHYVHNVSTQIQRFTLGGQPRGVIDLPGVGSGALYGLPEDRQGFLEFYSFNTPVISYAYDVKTGRRIVFAKTDVSFDADRFEVRQVWYPSKDGTRIPMFLFHKKGLQPDGKLATLLNGYGGFGALYMPAFLASAALWAEQGGVYAVPGIRGGGEFGEAWHRAGMLEKKQNVFDDFIAAAEWLISNQYTNAKRLAIQGYSNGGLLVGAALTQRPDLFRAVLCEHPDLDIVGAPRFKNFNKPALLEYGDASKPDQFPFVRAYSPYQNVKDATPYPAVMLTTGHADTRVPPLQARKMTARLQAATTSGLPVLLLYDVEAGHAGGRPQSKLVEYVATTMAFLLWQLDVPWTD